MFPTELNRVQYLVRWIVFFVVFGVSMALLAPLQGHLPLSDLQFEIALGVLAIVLVVFKIGCIDIPRIRNIGWNPVIVWLFLIPVVGGVIQILLWVMPPYRRPEGSVL